MPQPNRADRPLLSESTRVELGFRVLRHMGKLGEVEAALAGAGLPDPRPADAVMHSSPKYKVVLRYFDAIDWADADQVQKVFALCHKALRVMRDERRRRREGFTNASDIQDVQRALESDGYTIDSNRLEIVLLGPRRSARLPAAAGPQITHCGIDGRLAITGSTAAEVLAAAAKWAADRGEQVSVTALSWSDTFGLVDEAGRAVAPITMSVYYDRLAG